MFASVIVYAIVLPASTMLSAAVFVTSMSAWVTVRLEAVALLLARLGSVVVEVTLTVLLMTVPAGVLGATWNTTTKLAETPEASVAIVAVIGPVPP